MFEARIRELVTGQATLGRIAEAMLSARATLQAEYEKLHKAVLGFVREDAVCRRLMTVPGVGPVVAVTFKSAVDDPSRITKSKAVGALFGCGLTAQLTAGPKRSRSQRRLDQGGIRDASGPNRGPYCPKSRRRDGGVGEAATRPVAVIRRTTRI